MFRYNFLSFKNKFDLKVDQIFTYTKGNKKNVNILIEINTKCLSLIDISSSLIHSIHRF